MDPAAPVEDQRDGRPRSCGRPRTVDRLLAVAIAVVATVAGLLQLFHGPDLGLADNGDWGRLLCRVDLQPPPATARFGEVVFDLEPLTDPAAASCDDPALHYSSSQFVLVAAVRAVDRLVGEDPGLDLRWVGAVVCVLLGAGLAALFLALPGRRSARLSTVAVATVASLDPAYAHYASSAYTETAGLLGTVWTVGALAWAARRPLGWRSTTVLMLATTVLVTAKNQLTPLAAVVVAVVLVRAWRQRRAGRRGLLLAAAFTVLLAIVCTLQLGAEGDQYHRANLHNLLLYTVLPLTADPADALAEMGLDPAMAIWSGTSAFEPGPLADPAYPAFIRSVDRTEVAAYLVAHPDVAGQLIAGALTEVTDPRTPYLAELAAGESGRDSGRDGGPPQADRWAPASALLAELRPAAPWVLPLLWAAMAGWGVVLLVRRSVGGSDLRAWGAALLFTALAAPAEVLVAALGDGDYELAKHEVFVSHLTWLGVALALGSVLQAAARPPVAAEQEVSVPSASPGGLA